MADLPCTPTEEDQLQIIFVFETFFKFLNLLEFNKSLKIGYLKAFESAFVVLNKDPLRFRSLHFKIIVTSKIF